MDTLAIVSLATQMSQVRTADAIQMAVLRKAMDVQAQTAEQLLQAVVQSGQAVNPPQLGNTIDTFA